MSKDMNSPKDVMLILLIIAALVLFGWVVVSLIVEIAWSLTEIFKG